MASGHRRQTREGGSGSWRGLRLLKVAQEMGPSGDLGHLTLHNKWRPWWAWSPQVACQGVHPPPSLLFHPLPLYFPTLVPYLPSTCTNKLLRLGFAYTNGAVPRPRFARTNGSNLGPGFAYTNRPVPRLEFARTNGLEFQLRFACVNGPAFSRPRSLAYRGQSACVAWPQGAPGFARTNGPASRPGFASTNRPAFERSRSLAYRRRSGLAAWPGRAPGFAWTNRPMFGRPRSLAYRGQSGPTAWPQGAMEFAYMNRPLGPAYGSPFRWTAQETYQYCWLGHNIRCNIPGNFQYPAFLSTCMQGGRPAQILDPNQVRKLSRVWRGGVGGYPNTHTSK